MLPACVFASQAGSVRQLFVERSEPHGFHEYPSPYRPDADFADGLVHVAGLFDPDVG